jgi:Na+/proline symporter
LTIVGGYLLLTTAVGVLLSGRQQTFRDFFLGGRTIPWYAVAGSIVSTEVSAVTFIGVPAIAYGEIYSPYDYLERRLGPRVKRLVTVLFLIGQLLGQGVRIGLLALVLEVATGGTLSLHQSIWLIGAVSIAWTLIGGISSVVWTDGARSWPSPTSWDTWTAGSRRSSPAARRRGSSVSSTSPSIRRSSSRSGRGSCCRRGRASTRTAWTR